jgi:thioredoxin reductase/Pyruvate/2-oxoacid:ferredoxin oxidoreductase delta subunit
MTANSLLLVYALPAAFILSLYLLAGYQRHRRSTVVLEAAREAGLTEPASLHPKIDPLLCRGCAACVTACPEGNILGLINGRAALIEPTLCIGHGACAASCPFDAISLVFGTEERGVDLPMVGEDFQTNVPGIYIGGELGGMGLIRNAIEQGRQALAAIHEQHAVGRSDMLDVAIIGAGPAGFSASLAAVERNLRYVTLEQDTLGGAVAHFPRGKLVMTQPAQLPLIGKVKFREVSKEKLLNFWQSVEKKTGLRVNYNERVDQIVPTSGGFEITTTRAVYRSRSVLLAIGRRGTPRKLGVPGEEQEKVVYRLVDAEQYRGQNVLVVGGGDSALEAAASIAEEPGTTVTLSYRSEAFGKAKLKNRNSVKAASAAGRLAILFKSSVVRIEPKHVEIEQMGRRRSIANDAVIVCAGGILPTRFLKNIGIEIETKYGTA